MKLTTKGRYAVMAMADLALFKDKGPTSLTDIAFRQNISLAYLEQIFIKLKDNNLVTVCLRDHSSITSSCFHQKLPFSDPTHPPL